MEYFNLYAKDGTITTKEATLIISVILKADREDNDGNGTIDFAEFLIKMSRKKKEIERREQIKKGCNVLDTDGTGFVSTSELRHVMTNLAERIPDTEVEKLLEKATITEDDQVNYEEFVKRLTIN
jgi:calmodulin